ncbi:hypothetical protein E9228_002799 [Curtobacterium flaccumfaciens]|uniref:Uncharacterized protein n=1 Tax=Curtobacterium salicis TaxID=1779862 RepID=A0ABX0TCF4_9MICO|nr:hypothetical protein [Curtobacterium sp. WW7]NII42141.1 hypothetical protein [Curtobacterium sp. WW7]
MTEYSAARGPAISSKRPVARVNLAISEVDRTQEGIAVVGTKAEVSVRGEGDDEDDAYCNVLSEYVVTMELDAPDPLPDELSDELGRFAMEHTFARHRERIMEATMRMGIPLLRLPLTLEEVEERANAVITTRIEADPKETIAGS